MRTSRTACVCSGAAGALLALLSACATHSPDTSFSANASRDSRALDSCLEQTAFEPARPLPGILAVAHSTIRVEAIEPRPGTVMSGVDALVVTLHYAVAHFALNRYAIMAQFDTTTPGRTTSGVLVNTEILPSARGRLHLCVPLSGAWIDPTISRPFRVRFLLNRISGKGRSTPHASTAVLTFPATTPSIESGSPVPERWDYFIALFQVHMAFEMLKYLSHECSARFPDLSPMLDVRCAQWSARYAAARSRVHTLFNQWVVRTTDGNQRMARAIIEQDKQILVRNVQAERNNNSLRACMNVARYFTMPASNPAVALAPEWRELAQHPLVPGGLQKR